MEVKVRRFCNCKCISGWCTFFEYGLVYGITLASFCVQMSLLIPNVMLS